MTDEEREARIDLLLEKMLEADCPTAKRMWWCEAAREINSRSHERVAQMEREKGLCTPS